MQVHTYIAVNILRDGAIGPTCQLCEYMSTLWIHVNFACQLLYLAAGVEEGADDANPEAVLPSGNPIVNIRICQSM